MHFEDFFLEQRFSLPPVLVDGEKMLTFATDYDPLPIHLDSRHAEATRFKDIIAPGHMSFLLVWQEFLRQSDVAGTFVAGLSNHLDWLAPVFAGDTLRGEAAISDLADKNAYNGVVTVSMEITNQNGAAVTRSLTRVVIAKRNV